MQPTPFWPIVLPRIIAPGLAPWPSGPEAPAPMCAPGCRPFIILPFAIIWPFGQPWAACGVASGLAGAGWGAVWASAPEAARAAATARNFARRVMVDPIRLAAEVPLGPDRRDPTRQGASRLDRPQLPARAFLDSLVY